MSDNQTLLQLEGVGYAYDAGNTAVFGVRLSISRGEILLVAGANGSGKTSLLKLMGGFLTAAEGAVTFQGKDVDDIPESRLDELVAFVRTESEKALVGPTVEDELARACRMSGLSGAAIPERVGQALESVSLKDARNWYLDEMSVGERRRVALAAALIGRPRLVLLDDPLGDLDANGVRVVSKVLRELCQRGLGVVFSSHQLEGSITLADRMLVLDQGEIVLEGTPRQALDKYQILRDAGLALPAAAEIVHQLRESGRLESAYLPLSVEESVQILEAALLR